jgi:hypothetical protein
LVAAVRVLQGREAVRAVLIVLLLARAFPLSRQLVAVVADLRQTQALPVARVAVVAVVVLRQVGQEQPHPFKDLTVAAVQLLSGAAVVVVLVS